jgi:hypothetical protein
LVLGELDGFDDDLDGEVVACFADAGGVGRAEEGGEFGEVGTVFCEGSVGVDTDGVVVGGGECVAVLAV